MIVLIYCKKPAQLPSCNQLKVDVGALACWVLAFVLSSSPVSAEDHFIFIQSGLCENFAGPFYLDTETAF